MRWVPRRKRALPLLGLLGLLSLVLTACAPPPIDGQGYEIVFQDEFNGTALDTSVWATAPFGGSLPGTVADGALTLRTTAANNYNWGHLASTGPRSTSEPNYPGAKAWQEGYFEARIRFTDNPWSWPAFHLFSMAKTEAFPGEDCTRLTAEWDIMENGVPNRDGTKPASSWYFTALHRNTGDGTDDGYCGIPDTQRTVERDFTGTNLSDWHVWAGRWTANQLCTYLDNVEIQCMTPYDTMPQPQHLIFTMQYLQNCGGCPPRPASLEMQVDWVRVWQQP
jgi:hypothetical protein